MNFRHAILFLAAIFFAGSASAQSLPGNDAPPAGLPMANYDNPRQYVVGDINVHGVRYLDAGSLAASAGLVRGETVTVPGSYVTDAINKMMARRYFSTASVVAETVGDTVNFEIYLTERPRVYRWDFTGLRKGEVTDLKEKMKLKPGGELSDYIIDKHILYIKDYLRDKAFRNAEVGVFIQNDTLYQNAVNVLFKVEKNDKVKVGKIEFEGNEVFSDKRLRRTFKKTHEKSINFFKNSKFKESEYEEDKLRLIDFYNSKGYRNANIIADSIYLLNPKRLGIKIDLEEGNKYYYRNITWIGNSRYDTETLQRILGIREGEAYDRKTLHKRLGLGAEGNPDEMSVTTLYQNDGYLFFRLDPAEIIIGADSLDLELRIFEGKQATINNVTISGNTGIDDEVIRRELYTRPGELYDRSLLMATMRQLMQMQHFNQEAIFPNVNPVTMSGELVDIGWNLEETSSDNFEVSGGWGAGMLVFSIGVNLNNVSLKRFFEKGAWRPYPRGQGQRLSIRAQTNGQYYKAFALSFTEPWLGGRKPISLTVATHYSDETNAVYLWRKATAHFRTIGLSVGIGQRLNWPDPYFTLYNEVSYQAYNLKNWNNFVVSDGSSNIIAFRTVFGRNSVDAPIYPRSGSDFSMSVTLTPPYSLFDNRDYRDKEMSNNARYGWVEFHKWLFKGQWFTALSRNNNLVLMARAEMGYLGAYNQNRYSPFEGFDMGGSGMTGYNVYGVDVVGLRGYGDGDITPLTGDYAHVYNKYTLELRYPVILQPATQIYGLVFAEGGNAFTSWKEFNPFELKRSLGVGLRINLQIIGMIGVDWGWGFDRAAGANRRHGGQFSFVFGQQF